MKKTLDIDEARFAARGVNYQADESGTFATFTWASQSTPENEPDALQTATVALEGGKLVFFVQRCASHRELLTALGERF